MITSASSVLFQCKGIGKRLRFTTLVSALAVITACSGEQAPKQTSVAQAPAEVEVVAIAPVAIQETQTATTEVDSIAEHFDYESITGISGNLSSIGSDTLANLMTLWTEGFKRNYPSVNIQVQAGSSTAPPALTEGTANFGPMSRAMKDKEIESFESRFGYKPTAIRVAIDALAVYVHKDSPLEALSIAQVDAAFPKPARCGAPVSVDSWGDFAERQLGGTPQFSFTGATQFQVPTGILRKLALCSGDFKGSVNEQPGSASVVQAVASSLNGLGYSGIGYITRVKALALSKMAVTQLKRQRKKH